MDSGQIARLLTLPSSYEKASYFYSFVIREELGAARRFLTEEEASGFAGYYGGLDTKDDHRANHFIHRHAQRVQHLVGAVTQGTKVLDAGCGFGSESILCGILGASVTGVDLIQPWLDTAVKRLSFYEGILGSAIPVEFHARSVFDVRDSFDVIWSLESISHIDPAEEFLAFAHERLKEGGRLIISDPNKLNPMAYWNARKAARRQGGLHGSTRNPETGEMVPYAHERLLDVFSIKRLLSANGFAIESFSQSGFLPYLPHLNIGRRNLSLHLESLNLLILPLTWLAGIYTVVATRR